MIEDGNTRGLNPLEQNRDWERQLEEYGQKLNAVSDSDPEDQRQKARILAAMGALSNLLGRPADMVRYVTEARALASDDPTLQTMYRLAEMMARPGRATPWDVEGAVDQYDDLMNLLTHQHLSFEEFFEKTHRGTIRKTICQMVTVLAKPGRRILEVGCAAGGYYASLRPFIDVSRYVAVDFTPSMVKRAKRIFPELHALRMDVRDLAFPDDAFSVVFSTDVLMHVDEWQRGLAELYRVTEGGLVLRIRVRLDDARPTFIGRVGSGEFRVPYVINNKPEFEDILRNFEPSPADVMFAPAEAEGMYGALWQLANENPELLQDAEFDGRIYIDGILDLVVLKRRLS